MSECTRLCTFVLRCGSGLVAQLVRAPACHAGGCGFESRPGRHFFKCAQSASVEKMSATRSPKGEVWQIKMEMAPSSRGLGHRPFKARTGVRIPVGSPSFHFKFGQSDLIKLLNSLLVLIMIRIWKYWNH